MSRHLVPMRTRFVGADAESPSKTVLREWILSEVAVVVCDMWDAYHCITAAQRTAVLATQVNRVVSALRNEGALIIHAPAGCSDFYAGTSARVRATNAPTVPAPCTIDWNDWERDEVNDLPDDLVNPGPCMCTGGPCNDGEPPYPWTRQTPVIEVTSDDAVTDDGQEVFNLLECRGIVDVLVMGVHTNACVLGRPYGIRQLVRLGKRPVLCRDLTDAFHRGPRGHRRGTEQVVAHIERRWCPSTTSDLVVGGEPFALADERSRV